ncbi:MAG: TatD family hydrolase [Actinomycetota bacterium]
MWFDNHCHLTSLDTDPAQVVADAADAGVDRLLTVGCTVADSARAAEIASQFDRVWSTAGVHPHDAKDGVDGLDALLDGPTIVAVGECGLDYHYNHSPADDQAEVFRHQIALAHRRELALVIHTREAWDDTFAILDDEGMPPRTVFHCFTGGPAEAEAALERGGYLSFSGIVTFPSAGDLREAALLTPSDRLLVETDSPYLAPVPHRGKPNRPAHVSVVGEFLAELLDVPPDDLAASTTANALALYGLD